MRGVGILFHVKQNRSPLPANDRLIKMRLRDTMAGRRGGIPPGCFLNDPNFYDTTADVCVIVFDIQSLKDRMRLVSRGTMANIGQ